jgi:hypothetical protein
MIQTFWYASQKADGIIGVEILSHDTDSPQVTFVTEFYDISKSKVIKKFLINSTSRK